MFNFPFFNYPYNYSYYRYYNRYNSNFENNLSTNKLQKEQEQTKITENEKDSIANSKRISNTTFSKTYSDTDQAVLEIFGIKLYLDDLIIIGLLFFLYQQNVTDEMLYMILFLLLFS